MDKVIVLAYDLGAVLIILMTMARSAQKGFATGIFQLVGRLALAAGLLPEYAPITPAQLLPYFAWDKLPRRDFVFEL